MYRSKTGAANRGSILSTLKATEMLDSSARLPAGKNARCIMLTGMY